MPTDLEQQLARFAEALDREAPTISFDDMVGRGTVAVDVDLLERSRRIGPPASTASRGSTPRPATTRSANATCCRARPRRCARRPAWRRVGLKVALGVAAVAVLVVALAAIERGEDELDPADVPTSPAPPRSLLLDGSCSSTVPTPPPTTTEPPRSGGMWPQATLEEVRAPRRSPTPATPTTRGRSPRS